MKKKNERHIAILLAVMMIFMNFIIAPVKAEPGDVAIDATNFPDPKFMEYVKKKDKDSNGILSQDELNAVKRINVQSIGITKLKGVEHFTELERLDCRSNHLAVLDLKDNTKLISLLCAGNQLTNLNLSQNKNLVTLYCDQNQLTTLNLTNNTELGDLSCSYNQLTNLALTNNTELLELSCGQNYLTTLDLSTNTKLTKINCEVNQLSKLDLSKNINLETLYCSSNQLTTLDLSTNTKLKYLSCSSNQLAALDLTNTAVTYLSGSNQERSVPVPEGSPSLDLTTLVADFDSEKMSDLNGTTNSGNNLSLTSQPELVTYTYKASTNNNLYVKLNIIYGDAVKVTFDRNKGTGYMKGLSLKADSLYRLPACKFKAPAGKVFDQWEVNGTKYDAGAEITVKSDITVKAIWKDLLEINETNFKDETFRNYVKAEFDKDHDGYLSQDELNNVTEIDVSNKNIKNLKGIEYFTNIRKLNCYNNQLTDLDISKNTNLIDFSCAHNQLTDLNLSNNKYLKTLRCDENQLTDLNLSNNKNLKNLNCSRNPLETLNLSENKNLETLTCEGNQLTTLNLSKNEKLTKINCQVNKLSELDLKNNTNLEYLYCSQNHLKKLDLSKNTKLKALGCSINKLTNLDLSANTAVTSFSGNNQEYDIEVDKSTLSFNLNSLPGKFEPSKASDWKGGKVDTVNSNILKLDKNTITAVTYEYNVKTGLDKLKVKLKVKYKETPPTVDSIAVNSTEHKTEYKVGEPLDVTNLTILVTMTNSTTRTENVTAEMVGDFDTSTAGTKTLTITYQGKKTTYNINVTADPTPPPTPPTPTPTPTPDPYYPGYYDDWYEPYRPYKPHRPYRPAEDKKSEEKPEEKPIDKPAEKVETEVIFVIGSNNMDTKINGTDSFKGMDAAPYIKNGRTMLPIRYIAEALGMSVSWDAKTRTVIIQDMFYTVEIPVDTNIIKVNGEVFTSDVKPEIVHGRTMLPIANIARALGLVDGKDIIWDASKRQVIIKRIYDKKEN